jgi:hypothetical protein
LEAKLLASSKALKDIQTRLATIEAKCKKDVAAVEAKAAKAEKKLAEANQKQAKREQAVSRHVETKKVKKWKTYFVIFLRPSYQEKYETLNISFDLRNLSLK